MGPADFPLTLGPDSGTLQASERRAVPREWTAQEVTMRENGVYWLGVTILTSLAALQAPAGAAIFNPGTAAQFQTDLNTAAGNGADDTINLPAATFETDDNGNATFTYTAAATETNSLTIRGAGIGNTILDGNSARAVLRIDLTTFRDAGDDSAAMILVEGVTVRNGMQTGERAGGLIIETDAADITVRDSSFNDNAGADGGGLLAFTFSGEIMLSGSTFLDNSTASQGHNGGGAQLRSKGGPVSAVNNTFTNNTANGGDGGGLYARSDGGAVTVTGSTFTENEATSGFPCADEGAPDNVGKPGGTDDPGAEGNGGGAYIHSHPGGEVLVEGNTFRDNDADCDGGGANVTSKSALATVRMNTFDENQAHQDGGGLQLDAKAQVLLEDNEFTDNDADGEGGGVQMAGGASGRRDVLRNKFVANETEGTAGVGQSGAANPGDGGGLHSHGNDPVHLAENEFSENVAGGGGGGAHVGITTGGDPKAISFDHNVFFWNTAEGAPSASTPGGGGLHADVSLPSGGAGLGSVDLTNNTLAKNMAPNANGDGISINVEEDADRASLLRNIVFQNGPGVDIYVDDLDPDVVGDLTGSVVELIGNDFDDFVSLCENTANCVPNVTREENLSVDPKFVSMDKDTVDLHLSTNSPLVNMDIGAFPLILVTAVPVLGGAGLILLILAMFGIVPLRSWRERRQAQRFRPA
jgi:hypothetical protein